MAGFLQNSKLTTVCFSVYRVVVDQAYRAFLAALAFNHAECADKLILSVFI